jgi:hypothetical protein
LWRGGIGWGEGGGASGQVAGYTQRYTAVSPDPERKVRERQRKELKIQTNIQKDTREKV